MENKRRKKYLVTQRADFLKLQKQGQRIHPAKWMVVNLLANGLDHHRVGWTIPKFVGSAVLRNRLRRWGRELLRTDESLRIDDLAGYDINFVFRRMEKDFYGSLTRSTFDATIDRAISRGRALRKK